MTKPGKTAHKNAENKKQTYCRQAQATDTINAFFQSSTMKLLSTLVIILSVATPGSVLAQGSVNEQKGLGVSVGLGLLSGPSYLGNDDSLIRVLPALSVTYGERFKASLRGIEYTAFARGGWRVGPVLSYDFGREEDIGDGPFDVSGKSSDLKGLGDVEGTLKLGVTVEYESRWLTTKFEFQQGIDGGHDGLTGEASISYRSRFTAMGPSVFLSIGPAIAFGDDSYVSAFFDVNARQSAASGITQFDADGGVISVGLHSSAFLPISKTISIVGLLKYDQLTGDVEQSSLVTERGSKDQITAGLFVNYRF